MLQNCHNIWHPLCFTIEKSYNQSAGKKINLRHTLSEPQTSDHFTADTLTLIKKGEKTACTMQ